MNEVNYVFNQLYLLIFCDNTELFAQLYTKENLELVSISDQVFIFPKSLILYNSEGRF